MLYLILLAQVSLLQQYSMDSVLRFLHVVGSSFSTMAEFLLPMALRAHPHRPALLSIIQFIQVLVLPRRSLVIKFRSSCIHLKNKIPMYQFH